MGGLPGENHVSPQKRRRAPFCCQWCQRVAWAVLLYLVRGLRWRFLKLDAKMIGVGADCGSNLDQRDEAYGWGGPTWDSKLEEKNSADRGVDYGRYRNR